MHYSNTLPFFKHLIGNGAIRVYKQCLAIRTSFISAVRYKDTNYRKILQRVPMSAIIRAYKRTYIREIWSVLIARHCL